MRRCAGARCRLPGPRALQHPAAPPSAPPRPLVIGLCAGALALGADYLAHALFSIPLLPEQAGNLLLKILPLPVFANLLKALGVLARPLLLAGSSVVIIEVIVLAGTVLLVDSFARELALFAGVDNDRRVLLRNLFYGAAGIAILGIAYANVRRLTTALATQEGSRADTEITAVNDFYVVSKNLGGDPVVDASSWRLNLPTRSLTYAQLLAMPAQQLELTLECISNDIGGTLISNGSWKGPRVSDVLAMTSVPRDAVWMLIESADGYTESFPLQELTTDHLLATHLNGAPLTAPHGFPARFLFPGHYGMKQPKWVTRIRFSATDQPGYWENNGWDERAIVKTMSRIDRPADGAAQTGGPVTFAGIAFAGARRISAAELSWDGGASWQPAQLQPEFSPYAWRFWQLTATLPAGQHQVSVRARDGEGTLQSSKPAPTLPNGADGYHTITIDLA
ncbi:MAG: oxidoreductase [Chloroflexi bacterium]|nr:MAG: oxidoreductase [Chloroflexota bacterium]